MSGKGGETLTKRPLTRIQIRHDWDVMYAALLSYAEVHGHCNVPQRNSRVLLEDGTRVRLGAWLATQRKEHLSGHLKEDRMEKLQKLAEEGKLNWAPQNRAAASEVTWPYYFEAFKLYLQELREQNPHQPCKSIGEGLVWRHSKDNSEVALGKWMHTQYKLHRVKKLRHDRAVQFEPLIEAGVFRWPISRKSRIPSEVGPLSGAADADSSIGEQGGSSPSTKRQRTAFPSNSTTGDQSHSTLIVEGHAPEAEAVPYQVREVDCVPTTSTHVDILSNSSNYVLAHPHAVNSSNAYMMAANKQAHAQVHTFQVPDPDPGLSSDSDDEYSIQGRKSTPTLTALTGEAVATATVAAVIAGGGGVGGREGASAVSGGEDGFACTYPLVTISTQQPREQQQPPQQHRQHRDNTVGLAIVHQSLGGGEAFSGDASANFDGSGIFHEVPAALTASEQSQNSALGDGNDLDVEKFDVNDVMDGFEGDEQQRKRNRPNGSKSKVLTWTRSLADVSASLPECV